MSNSRPQISEEPARKQLKRLYKKSDKQSEEILDEEQNEQLNNHDWLMRVIEHLLPLSEPIPDLDTDKEKFLALKKQWAYTGEFFLVDAKSTDCTLCDHQHVASLFTIINTHNQNQTEAASHCIKQFNALNQHGLFHDKSTSKEIIERDILLAGQEKEQERRSIRKFFLSY